jgi:NAD(P)-dependent dehydrogenase (short-subunit alcohol dehydrogenase family)
MSVLTGLKRLYQNKWAPPKEPTASFAGKTVLITGANVGLGLEAAIKFVALGASSLIMGVRNLEKGNNAKEVIERRSNRKGVVQVWHLDMSAFDGVKAFADRVNGEVKQLDVVLLNAGLLDKEYHVSPEGWEQTLQVNVLSTALLALLLLPKLRASTTGDSPTHLAIVSSGTHIHVRAEQLKTDGGLLDFLNRQEGYNGQRQYGNSKILVEWIVKELAAANTKENGNIPVIIGSLCPGFCYSDLARSYKSWVEWLSIKVFYGLFARSTEQGSRTLVSATAQGVEAHGKYFKDDGYPE